MIPIKLTRPAALLILLEDRVKIKRPFLSEARMRVDAIFVKKTMTMLLFV